MVLQKTKVLIMRMLGFPVKVIKGGSYLCAPNYCMRMEFWTGQRLVIAVVADTHWLGTGKINEVISVFVLMNQDKELLLSYEDEEVYALGLTTFN